MGSLGIRFLSLCSIMSMAFGAKGRCCEYVLVSARGPIASVQGAALGQYFWNGTDPSTGKEFYKKLGKKGPDYFMYYDSGKFVIICQTFIDKSEVRFIPIFQGPRDGRSASTCPAGSTS